VTGLATLCRAGRRKKERADRLAESLKSVHRAMFDGNVFNLILKACMGVTGATRGLYVAAWGGDQFRVRAAVEMGGIAGRPPSAFIETLCREALEGRKTILVNHPDQQTDLPKPAGPDETFRNCMVAPAVLLKEMSGLVILADKISGEFDEQDAEIVLSVGDQAAVAVENGRLQKELADAYFSIVGVVADAVEAKDPNLHGQCESSRMAPERKL
jgi:GAF domain-containing protein